MKKLKGDISPARLAAMLAASLLLATAARAQELRPGAPSDARCGPSPSLTYLANEAVLIRGEATVLIDGPFTAGVRPYPRMTARSLRRAKDAEPPFDEIDWVLVSHAHADHVAPGALADLLEANFRARLASTRSVIDRVRAAASADDVHLGRRLMIVGPAEGESAVLQEEAPRIEVFSLHHGRHRDVENLGFLVDVDGIRFLHVGDAEVVLPDIEPLALGERAVDVALLPSWYVTGEDFRPVVGALGAKRVYLMHLPVQREADRHFRRFGGWDGVARLLSEFDSPIRPLLRRDRVLCPLGLEATDGW